MNDRLSSSYIVIGTRILDITFAILRLSDEPFEQIILHSPSLTRHP